eukprot:COSAG05_NODE_21704_length_270_cov_0.573099_1_plen_46_part_01
MKCPGFADWRGLTSRNVSYGVTEVLEFQMGTEITPMKVHFIFTFLF